MLVMREVLAEEGTDMDELPGCGAGSAAMRE